MITRSFGGILFIDEAYGLYKEDSRDYGSEVIEMLVKFIDMTENKDFVLVLAGYRNLMTRMLNANLNLMSRMGNWIGTPLALFDLLLSCVNTNTLIIFV